jgi:hypothetical protein
VQAPKFEVDPDVAEAAADNMILGQVIGVGVDAQDHVWIVHRSDLISAAEPGRTESADGVVLPPAPPIMEFAPDGTLLLPGAARARATSGRSRITASPSITKVWSWIGGNVGADAQS